MKRPTHAQLKKRLWKVFTLWIKNRDKWTCVTCGRKVEGQNAQGGHYIAKAACGLDYYFSEINVAAQCAGCNLHLEGNRPAFRRYLVSRYGEAVVNELEQNYHRPCKWSQADFEERIARYSNAS